MSGVKVTQKQRVAKEIAKCAYRQHGLADRPVVLMWRTLICECFPEYEHQWPQYSAAVHSHYKRFGNHVRNILYLRYGVACVPVSRAVTALAKHGEEPTLDEERRTDEAWRQCLPTAHAKTYGIVCFPPNATVDHPLLVAALERRGKASFSSVLNAKRAIDNANVSGIISQPTTGHLIGHMHLDESEQIKIPTDQRRIENLPRKDLRDCLFPAAKIKNAKIFPRR
jgi:hypothetical protein